MKTILLKTIKINDNSFLMDFLYDSTTSYSKSLYPTIRRHFAKNAKLMGGGSWKQEESTIAECGMLPGSIEHNIYYIKRVIFNRI